MCVTASRIGRRCPKGNPSMCDGGRFSIPYQCITDHTHHTFCASVPHLIEQMSDPFSCEQASVFVAGPIIAWSSLDIPFCAGFADLGLVSHCTPFLYWTPSSTVLTLIFLLLRCIVSVYSASASCCHLVPHPSPCWFCSAYPTLQYFLILQ